jgi:Zn-dependent oligopeptidase
MMVIHLLTIAGLTSQLPDDRTLKGSNLTIMRGIKRMKIEMLRPYIGKPVRLQHVFNVYQDYKAVFGKRFSTAQRERNWHVAIHSGNLSKKTPAGVAKRMLGEFSRDISGIDGPNDGWYPSTFKHRGKAGLTSKIASGAFYIFEFQPGVKGKPKLMRLWDLDHAKGWEDHWLNREVE